MSAIRTVWMALVSFYEETFVLVTGNLAALVLNVPIAALLLLVASWLLLVLGVPLAGDGENALGLQWELLVIAWLLPLLPTPGNVALGGLSRIAAGPDVPRFAEFRQRLKLHWRLALRCSLLSLVVTVALVANVYFYGAVSSGWLRFASILWLYATLFWLSLHIYLVPMLLHVAEPRLIDLYRRAAFIALGHPAYTISLLLALLGIGLLTVIFLPAYVLVGPAFISIAQAHALREIRRRHGDLLPESEEVSRL